MPFETSCRQNQNKQKAFIAFGLIISIPNRQSGIAKEYRNREQSCGLTLKAKIYNEEGRLVAINEKTILELLEEAGYLVNPDEKEMEKLRIESGVYEN